MDKIALRMMRCPKCGSKHIDAFGNMLETRRDVLYWFMCRDCGYNSPAYHDEARAISAFCKGRDGNEKPIDVWDGFPPEEDD